MKKQKIWFILQNKYDPCSGKKKQTIETKSGWAQNLDLASKDFKAAIINMFKELKENMLKN